MENKHIVELGMASELTLGYKNGTTQEHGRMLLWSKGDRD